MPAGAVQVPSEVVNDGPLTSVSIGRQEASSSGSVAVTQSTILRSPVVVVCSAGWSRSTPESMMPMVTPRPSHCGFAALKASAPVSFVGMYGFTAPVSPPGPASVWACAAVLAPFGAASGAGSGSLMVSSRSTAATPGSVAALSALSVGTFAST